MNAEFGSDGADLPMFGVKVTPDLRTGFWTDHATELTFVVGYVDTG
jgi:hypothetical protein